MTGIRNPADRLVCRINEITGAIEILIKDWVTSIYIKPDEEQGIEVSHHRKNVA